MLGRVGVEARGQVRIAQRGVSVRIERQVLADHGHDRAGLILGQQELHLVSRRPVGSGCEQRRRLQFRRLATPVGSGVTPASRVSTASPPIRPRHELAVSLPRRSPVMARNSFPTRNATGNLHISRVTILVQNRRRKARRVQFSWSDPLTAFSWRYWGCGGY